MIYGRLAAYAFFIAGVNKKIEQKHFRFLYIFIYDKNWPHDNNYLAALSRKMKAVRKGSAQKVLKLSANAPIRNYVFIYFLFAYIFIVNFFTTPVLC